MEALVSLRKGDIVIEGRGASESAVERSKTAILVKNLPADTTKEDLVRVFGSAGETPSKILLPPSRTIAVVEYNHGNDAKRAFRRLAYRRFKSVPLYLEWAPLAAKGETLSLTKDEEKHSNLKGEPETAETVDDDAAEFAPTGPTATIYVKNLNFKTSEDQLREFFSKHVGDVRAIRVPKKVVPARRVHVGGGSPTELSADEGIRTLSMGYAFVEFDSQESAKKVLRTLQGTVLDGHALELTPSSAKADTSKAPPAAAGKNPSKLLVRNVPFQASRKELLKLFGAFGQLRKVRLPKKFDGNHRGFAFVEYLTGKDAAAAMKSLARTHLYGRHLVIEWAEPDGEADRRDDGMDKVIFSSKRDVEASSEAVPAEVPPKSKKIRFE